MDGDEDGVPLCPLCKARLDADCGRAACDWLADPAFPADRLDDDGNIIPSR